MSEPGARAVPLHGCLTRHIRHSSIRVALAFVRAGHEVIGTTRSTSSAKGLEAQEITPRVVDPSDPASFRHLIAEVDVVIDTVGGNSIAEIGHTILDTAIAEAKKARPDGPPLSYIYCSGSVRGHL